jgi:hypothetical protein
VKENETDVSVLPVTARAVGARQVGGMDVSAPKGNLKMPVMVVWVGAEAVVEEPV